MQATSKRAAVREDAEEDALYPEAGPLALFSHMSRVSLFLQALQEECLEPFGLRFVDYSVLRILDYAGPPERMSPSKLAEAVVCTSGGMTRILDRLERQGWCERTRDPDDRRGVLVGLTPAGRRTSQQASDAYEKGRERILARLSEGEIDDLDTALRRILDVFEEDRRQA